MVRILALSLPGPEFHPWLGNQDPTRRAAWPKKEKNWFQSDVQYVALSLSWETKEGLWGRGSDEVGKGNRGLTTKGVDAKGLEGFSPAESRDRGSVLGKGVLWSELLWTLRRRLWNQGHQQPNARVRVRKKKDQLPPFDSDDPAVNLPKLRETWGKKTVLCL